MQKAIELKNQIDDLKKAIKKSNSIHLKNDYSKAIRRKEKELRYYCINKKINYSKIKEIKNEY